MSQHTVLRFAWRHPAPDIKTPYSPPYSFTCNVTTTSDPFCVFSYLFEWSKKFAFWNSTFETKPSFKLIPPPVFHLKTAWMWRDPDSHYWVPVTREGYSKNLATVFDFISQRFMLWLLWNTYCMMWRVPPADNHSSSAALQSGLPITMWRSVFIMLRYNECL